MVKLINWDCELTRPQDVSYFIRWTTRDAGANIFGVPQVVTPNIGVWQIDITLTRETRPEYVKRFEALVSSMRGRYHVADLCICDPYKYGSNVSPRQWPFLDDNGTPQWFTDGTGFYDPESGVQPMVTSQAASAGDNSVYFNLGEPSIPRLRVGDMFDHYGFLYRVTGSNNQGWVGIEPSLRLAIAAGVTLRTSPPHIYARLADDDQGIRMRERLRYGSSVTISFVEAFDRDFE